MSADNPAMDAEYLKRQRLIDELESSTNEKIRIITATSENDDTRGQGFQTEGGKPPHGHKMATEGELRASEIAAAEARTDVKIVRLEGKLDLVLQGLQSSREETRESRRAVIANAWVIFGALIVVVGILVTVAPVIFDLGFKWREAITKEVQERIPHLPPPSIQK